MTSLIVSSPFSLQHRDYRQQRAITQHLPSQNVMAQARHRETSLYDTDDESISLDALLRGMIPYAVKLRDFIMQNQGTRTLPPSPSHSPEGGLQDSGPTQKVKIPSLSTRRAACTHVTMERLYGGFKCHNCDKVSHFDWVYCCTQDEKIPAIDTVPVDLTVSSPFEPRLTGAIEEVLSYNFMDTQVAIPQLSPWVENAVKKGHYTPEQVKLLRIQKQTVINNTRITLQRFEQSQTSEKDSLRKPKAEQPLSTVPDPPLGTIHEVVQTSTMEKAESLVPLSAEPKRKMYPHCRYRACHHCRPTYRDRAWQCFDEVFSNDSTIDHDALEAEERPLASVSLLRTIGLRSTPSRGRPRLRSFDSRSIYTLDNAGRIVLNNNSYRKDTTLPSSADVADMGVEPESKGFRGSMKRAFKGMLMSRRSKSYSGLGREDKTEAGSSTTELDAVEFDVGLYRQLSDEVLREASGIPLPNDSTEDLDMVMGDSPVEGVAVTEEAVETGTADIIMSV